MRALGWTVRLLLAVLGLAGTAAVAEAQMLSTVIDSAGPLDRIFLGEDLACQVAHTSDGDVFELFPPSVVPGDCGTFLRLGNTIYGPDFTRHGQTATPFIVGVGLPSYSLFTFLDQTSVGGTGTVDDPFTVTTSSLAGTSGVRVEQEDRYVVGDELYTTKVTIINDAAVPVTGRLWRAGDCYLGAGDAGFGMLDLTTGEVGCTQNPNNVPQGRIEVWRPKTPGSSALQDAFGTVWSTINAGNPFPNTCECTVSQDNGAGLSWEFTIPGGDSATFEHDLLFSPTGNLPNLAPTASIKADDSADSCTDSAVRFDIAGTDADGMLVSWTFAFGDGATLSGTGSLSESFQHTYAVAGLYTTTLTVTDDRGATTTVTRVVDSNGDPNCCPTLAPMFDATLKEGRVVRLRALAQDLDDAFLTFDVKPALPAGATLGPSGAFQWPTRIGDAGDHPLTFSVTDGKCTAERAVVVHVLEVDRAPLPDDQDQDGVADDQDNCPSVPNNDQLDADLDGTGDACQLQDARSDARRADALRLAAEPDADRDGVPDARDVCPTVADRLQADRDLDQVGDACDPDLDGDGVAEAGEHPDACPTVPDPLQEDTDGDGMGDACDADTAAPSPLAKRMPAGSGTTAASSLPWSSIVAVAAVVVPSASAGVAVVAWAYRRGR